MKKQGASRRGGLPPLTALCFVSGAALCVAAGCGYENVLTLGAGVVTYADVSAATPSPARSFGLDVEWLHLFGVSSYLAEGEPLLMARVAPDLGLLSSTLTEHAPGRDGIPPWRFASSWAVRPLAGWWSWPEAPGGSGALAGLGFTFCAKPYQPLDQKESLVIEYTFLWLFEMAGAEPARVQTLRLGYVCGF